MHSSYINTCPVCGDVDAGIADSPEEDIIPF